ncbi:hypothetical protein [Hymenobacter properus]|uniref:Uncharacterized protein n=1 Tax=Hymenobacter properus TaxID=2791026 RepID=A0A931BE44_9BACT|nr:hypothetical protein [Hymenobacter properus]MBF9140828.1 hypothetical protein [Hymenobacter properus]MBR7719637.1 hypothetical protein [Microvirga sp. SRT04]
MPLIDNTPKLTARTGDAAAPSAAHREVLPRAVPTVTIYADGFSCLNAEASSLVARFANASLCLHAPKPVRPGRHPKLWELSAGRCVALSAHPDKPAQLRFRVPPAEAPPAGRYLLLPLAGETQRYSLLPG